MPNLQLRILTSESVKFDEPVDMVVMRCVYDDTGKRSSVGELGILPGHAPLSGVLGISPFRILQDGVERVLAVYGGVVNVQNNAVTVITERARWPEDIDRANAESEHERLERERETLSDDQDIRSNQIALRRALVEIEVSSYPLVGRK